MLRLAALTVVAAGLALPAAAQRQTFTETSPGVFDRQAAADRRAALHAELVGERVPAGLAEPLRATAPAAALAAIAADRGPRRMVGTVVPVSGSATLGRRDGFGAARVSGADWAWTGAVVSPGATALRLHFTDFYLPGGAELYLYTEDGQVQGPYTGRGPGGRGEFLSHTLFASSVVLHARHRGPGGAQALAGARIEVSGVGHMTDRFTLGALHAQADGRLLCNFNEACVENAECSNIPAAIAPAQDAVASMLFQSGAYLYLCSGGLLADSDSGSQIPYFLTANHCISRNNEAASLEAFFQFTTNCNGACYDPDGVVPSTLGSSIVAKAKNTDFTLLQLAEAAPPGSAFLGWNATPVAFADGTALFRVSHPGGAPQAYSEHAVDASAPTCGGWPRGNRIYSRDLFGATEGGSSGSPVLNAAGQVVGQLSGACGTNVGDVCDADSNATVDGAFAQYFDQVAPYLDGGSSCTDFDGDTYCAEVDDCDDLNDLVNPGVVEACDNGIDDDCDGLVDGLDPECGSCTPSGGSCTQDSQCCSNKCKGPPGNRTCR